jgi:ergothioneine biosynthesis glutamate--cysteine ligase EgtA
MAAQLAVADACVALASEQEARAHAEARALSPTPHGRVGLELEFHLVDLQRPGRRLEWPEVSGLLARVPVMPGGSRITVEPGGQLELSTLPMPDVRSAVRVLREDRTALSAALAASRLGLASLGTDPARPARRVNPASRYAAMERHFDAAGCGTAARAMMCATAALQINVDAGPASCWSSRMRHLNRLGPVLVAISACSPVLGGRRTGWRSMRQQVWGQLDQARCGPAPEGTDPRQDWASYAMAAPVMLVRDPDTGEAVPVTDRVPFLAWLSEERALAGRMPTVADLDYHLSTLFPPVRLRGFVELRCLDAVPDRWWPGLAALTVTLLDDAVVADGAAEACEPLAGAWSVAARDGLDDPRVARAARRCVELAAERCPLDLRREVEEYAELVTRGRSPGDEVREQADRHGPLAVLEAAAHAW